jgi:hypothetical protein
MTKVTELPFIGVSDTASFIVVDNKLTRRVSYSQLRNSLARFDQNLFTTSTVIFNVVSATNTVTAAELIGKTVIATQGIGTVGSVAATFMQVGGGSYDFIFNRFVPIPTLYVSNHKINSQGLLLVLQGYRDFFISNSSYKFPVIKGEMARGGTAAPEAIQDRDTLFAISAGGHDGRLWTGSRNVGNVGLLSFTAQGNWSGTTNTTTNAGARISLTVQPPGVYLSTSSQQTIIYQYWTEDTIPTNNIGFGGGADGRYPVSFNSSGTRYNGYGLTNVYLNNSTFNLWGVPREDSNPDNYALPDTLSIAFYASRGSGSSARRNRIRRGDTLGRIQFFGETDTQSTSTKTQIKTAELFVKSLNTFTSTATGGAVVVLTTLNSGTNIESPRLSLSNVEHIYSSDIHSFKTANSSTIVTINSTSFVVKSVRAVQGTVPAGFRPMYYNTSTGEIIVVY